MTTVQIHTPAGGTSGSFDLPAEFFDVQVNVPLMHQVVVAQLAAARQGTHDTKSRGEVSGGGKKPYKQKGTGGHRVGNARVNSRKGGGVTFEKTRTREDFRTDLTRKMRQLANRNALLAKLVQSNPSRTCVDTIRRFHANVNAVRCSVNGWGNLLQNAIESACETPHRPVHSNLAWMKRSCAEHFNVIGVRCVRGL